MLQREYEQLQDQHGQRGALMGGQWESETSYSHPDEADLLAEAKLLRQHKGRLEARMHILEEHNKQLESQLHRLRQLLHQVTPLLDSEATSFRSIHGDIQHRNNPEKTATRRVCCCGRWRLPGSCRIGLSVTGKNSSGE